MTDNPIQNEAQAKTAAKYVDYLANELRAGDAGAEEMDLILNRMVEIATNLADYEFEASNASKADLKLVVDNGFVRPTKDLTDYRRTVMRLAVNNS